MNGLPLEHRRLIILTTYKLIKISDLSTVKALEDDNSNEAKMLNFVFDEVENIMGKMRKCLYQHFLLMFSKGFLFEIINSLLNDKILVHSKLKAIEDDKINVVQKLQFVLGRIENILGKGGNANVTYQLVTS